MNAAEVYRRQMRSSASGQGELGALFAELVQTVAGARSAIAAAQLQDAHGQLVLAQQILSILRMGLAPEPAELVRNLSALYLHCELLLAKANMGKSVAEIDQALAVLTVLRDAWQEAAMQA